MLRQRARSDQDHGESDAAPAGFEEVSAERRLQGSVWELTGRLLFQRGEYARSEHAYKCYLDIAEELSTAPAVVTLPLARQGEPRCEAEALVRLIAFAESHGDTARARPHLERLLEVYKARSTARC
ncbi:hypothetical protein [Allokutzneria albata]|uniref:Tetratricopeptide repeat-containing protein n=1 Tax=Allokutzneria albata TaxID=211114 RepID=A0A1G9WJ76_ALLAB|nr:hypothetical protein [Allokutzneria albata]SDM84588.1 hypothetical protein SAMN04489726_3646 [Allokutzneria albata]